MFGAWSMGGDTWPGMLVFIIIVIITIIIAGIYSKVQEDKK
jgi:flagellar biosynthesis component FlhA